MTTKYTFERKIRFIFEKQNESYIVYGERASKKKIGPGAKSVFGVSGFTRQQEGAVYIS